MGSSRRPLAAALAAAAAGISVVSCDASDEGETVPVRASEPPPSTGGVPLAGTDLVEATLSRAVVPPTVRASASTLITFPGTLPTPGTGVTGSAIVDTVMTPFEQIRTCPIADETCPSAAAGLNGTLFSYDPQTAELTVHDAVPYTVGVNEPVSRLLYIGPGDVAYFAAVASDQRADVVAVATAGDAAGSVVATIAGAFDATGDTILVATPDGLAAAPCCTPNASVDADPEVPWVDADGHRQSEGRFAWLFLDWPADVPFTVDALAPPVLWIEGEGSVGWAFAADPGSWEGALYITPFPSDTLTATALVPARYAFVALDATGAAIARDRESGVHVRITLSETF